MYIQTNFFIIFRFNSSRKIKLPGASILQMADHRSRTPGACVARISWLPGRDTSCPLVRRANILPAKIHTRISLPIKN